MEENMAVQTHDFEADTGKILNIVINSLYSDRDIFLRELLSNASDAIHKRRFLGQTEPQLLNSSEDEISINFDEKKKTIEIYALSSWRHAVRAAARFSLKFEARIKKALI